MPRGSPSKRVTKSKTRTAPGMSVRSLKAYAAHLMEVIREPPPRGLAGKVFFTLDTLIHLEAVEFEQVARITRYEKTRQAVNYLVEHGELVKIALNHLCLPEQVPQYRRSIARSGLEARYASTIQRLVTRMPIDQPFSVMDVVSEWRTDPHLPADVKRTAVRNSLPRLSREHMCKKIDQFQYVVGGTE